MEFRREARLLSLDMMASILIGTAIGAARERAADDGPDEPQLWCRDSATRFEYGVYRNRGDDKSYTLAIGDSGTTFSVGQYNLGRLVTPSRGFVVSQSDGVTELVYPPFSRLPRPALVAGIPCNLGPMSSFDVRPGGDGGQTIIVPGN